jgi:hypothetical protein
MIGSRNGVSGGGRYALLGPRGVYVPSPKWRREQVCFVPACKSSCHLGFAYQNLVLDIVKLHRHSKPT